VIEVEKANFPVAMMCRCLDVAPSGFYANRNAEPGERAKQDAALKVEIKKAHEESRRTYGSPRVHAELQAAGHKVGRNRVARLMAEDGLFGRRKPKFRKTTDSDHGSPVAPNVLDRNFDADAPDRAWVADITYIWTYQGWMYLAVIIDLFSRRVVGWSMAEHMRTELVLNALEAALGSRVPDTLGLVFHSDRGSQYASGDYRAALDEAGITCSMSRRANCWDNAVAESFFSTLKTELVHDVIFMTRASAKTTIAEWIEVFYNRRRRHSTIGYVSPVEYERRYFEQLDAAEAA
jgi:transposase InsO family protein